MESRAIETIRYASPPVALNVREVKESVILCDTRSDARVWEAQPGAAAAHGASVTVFAGPGGVQGGEA